MRLALPLAVGLAALSLQVTAASNMYRWVDAKGQVHYSQTPPKAGGFKDVTPHLPPPPAGKATVSAGKPTGALPTPASIAEANKRTAEYNESVKAQNCKNSQARLAQVKTQGTTVALRQQADGSVVPYGPDDYQRDLGEAQKAVTASCG